MSQMNRGEALRCIQIAKKCISEGKMAKAQKFLTKSLRMYETTEAKALLESLNNPQTSASNSPPRSNPSPSPNLSNQSNGPNPSQSRQSSSNPSPSTSSSGPSPASRSGSSRMSTDDEVQMIRHILRSKDYYSTLGVSKNADEKELKKAYRKKALKCHPDRNKAPGAEEAFKKLSKAYDVLRDPRKKQIYDQYGEDSPQMNRASHGAQFQQMTPDDIIRMFFGGDFGPGFNGTRGGFHFHSGGFPQQRRRQRGEGGAQPDLGVLGNVMQLLPIILVFITMILPSLMTFGGQSGGTGFGGKNQMEGQYFSLEKHHPFTLEKRTEKMDTIYYVQPQRRGSWGYQRNKSPRMEREVEGAYLRKLLQQCQAQQEKEDLRIQKIMSNDIDGKERRRLLKKLMKQKRKFEKMDSKQCRKLLDYVGEL